MQTSLTRLAGAVRTFLEPVWVEWHTRDGFTPAVLSQGTCGRSSLFLRRAIIEELAIEAQWRCGAPRHAPDGPEIGPFGFFTGRKWESHAWVTTPEWIVDITADQFGAAAVIVCPRGNDRYRTGTDTALPEYRARREETVEALWPRWLVWRDVHSRGYLPR